MSRKCMLVSVCLLLAVLISACQPEIVYVPVDAEDGANLQVGEVELEEQEEEFTDEESWYTVNARCEYESVPADKTIIIWYQWGTLEKEQGIEFFEVTHHTIYVDDEEVQILAQDFGDAYFDEEQGFFQQGYWMDIGYLEPGYHEIATIAEPQEQVFDGWDWYGPGAETEYLEFFCPVEVLGDEEQISEFGNEEDGGEEWEGDEEGEGSACNRSKYVRETIPDNTVFTPGEAFRKTWTVRNEGECAWNTGYTFEHTQGARLDGEAVINLPEEVEPGEEITLSLDMRAPDEPGTYTGRWEIFSDEGEVLGWYSVVIDVVVEGEEGEEEEDGLDEGEIRNIDWINKHEFSDEIDCPSVFEVIVDIYGTENSIVFFTSEFTKEWGITHPFEVKSMQCNINQFNLCEVGFTINITEETKNGTVCITQNFQDGGAGIIECEGVNFSCR